LLDQQLCAFAGVLREMKWIAGNLRLLAWRLRRRKLRLDLLEKRHARFSLRS
jgi:hypothetical protein